MISKIDNIAKELGFRINHNPNYYFASLEKGDNLYEISLLHSFQVGHFRKVNNGVFYMCYDTTDLELVYKSILNEFKYELRKKKILKLLL